MIIKFSNLGAIKETDLDLRPLTVIIGPNNTNKTYIAYSIYGLWQAMKSLSAMQVLSFTRISDKAITLKITDTLIGKFIDNIAYIVKEFKENLENFFQDSGGRLFSKTSFLLNISHQEVREALDRLVSLKTLPPIENEPSLILSYNNNVLIIQSGNNEFASVEEHLKSLPITKMLSLVQDYLLPSLSQQFFSTPFLLPAERNGFVLTYKLLANRRYKFLKEIQRGSRRIGNNEMADRQRQLELLKEQGDIQYPQPIEDFWDFLTDLEFQQNVRIGTDEKNAFQLLANDIETEIQNKNKTILTTTKLGGKEIKISVKRGLSIDLYNASSSIKQLAPLLLYLRYRAAENDLLIIDEPEMGLHPESQARLLEALGILVNLGVKVLLTTHSPYFMAHLNNLVNGDMENPDVLKSQAKSLYMKDERAFLSMDQVSAYEMKDNKLCSLKDDDYGIRWDTLSDVSADIQQKFFEIFEKREAVSHGKEK